MFGYFKATNYNISKDVVGVNGLPKKKKERNSPDIKQMVACRSGFKDGSLMSTCFTL